MANDSLRYLRIGLWVTVVMAALGAGWVFLVAPGKRAATESAATALPPGIGDYRLTMTDGQPFTRETLKGQPSLVFFGFTHCPDVCPTTLGEIAGWQEELGPLGANLRTFFVTVDPERDTPEILKDYVSWLPGTTGVTGSVEETTKALKAFRVFARKVPLKDGGYSMDHSGFVMVFDHNGDFSLIINYMENPAEVLRKLRPVMRISSAGWSVNRRKTASCRNSS